MRPRGVVLSEQRDGFITAWHCQPPETGRPYQVLDQEWWADAAPEPERHIYRWRYAGEGGSGELMGRAVAP